MFRPTCLRFWFLLLPLSLLSVRAIVAGESKGTRPSAIQDAAEPVRAAFYDHLRARAAQCPARQVNDRYPASRQEWRAASRDIRQQLRAIFQFPPQDVPLEPRLLGRIDRGDFAIEKIVYRAEADNCVTANLYLPLGLTGPLPAIICLSGHGGSKSVPYNQYFGQMYARAGCLVLVIDTIGEEERDEKCRLGIRGHRLDHRIDRCQALGISVIGKMVYDVVRGVDYLCSRPEVDPRRIGCAGHSLGGTLTEYATAVDPRITLSIPTAWTCDFHEIVGELSCCWRPVGLLPVASDAELFALGAETCATLVPAGEADRTPMYPDLFLRTTITKAKRVFELFGRGDCLALHVTPRAGHHPFQLNRTTLAWVERHFDLPRLAAGDIDKLADEPPPAATLMAELPRPFADKSWQIGRLTDARAAWCDVRLLPADTLRCLSLGDEARPEFGMAGWMAAREQELAAAFRAPRSLREWEARRDALVPQIAAVLNLPERPQPTTPQVLGIQARGEARVVELKFGLLGLSSYLILPKDATHPPLVVYLHQSRTKQGALESPRTAQWLAAGKAVLALDCVPFEETTYLLGTSPTAYNVSHVLESLDALQQWERMAEADPPRAEPTPEPGRAKPVSQTLAGDCRGAVILRTNQQVSCVGEVDDVALLAAILDRRIHSVTVAAAAGSPAPKQGYRQNGVVPGLRALAHRTELLALLAPRELWLETTEPDREDLERVYALAGARERVHSAPKK